MGNRNPNKNDRTRNPDGDGNSHGGTDRSASDGDGSGGGAAVDGRHGPREAGSRARALVETKETVPRNEAQGEGRSSPAKEDQGHANDPVQAGRALSTRRQVELARLHPHGPQSAKAHHQQGQEQDGAS